MFRPTYKGEVFGTMEFEGIKEARRYCADELVKQGVANSSEELLRAKEDGKRIIDITGIRCSHRSNQLTVERKCIICGKTFYVASEKSLKKCCSAECRKENLRRYNARYSNARYKVDEDFAKRKLTYSAKAQRAYFARNRRTISEHIAKDVCLLAKEDDGEKLVSLFLYRSKSRHIDKFYALLDEDDKQAMNHIINLTGRFESDKIYL